MAAASGTEGILLGMGNPLLDISAVVPLEFAEKYGVKMNNAILAEEAHLPMYAEMVEKFAVEYIAGGATQNSIRVAQWMLQDNPGSTAYIGCVGTDENASKLEEAAASDGVATHYMKDATAATGTCAVLVNDKERSLVANLSAANNYKIDHMQTPEIQAVVEKAKVFYSSGFFLTVSPDTMVAVGKHAAENGKVYMLNLAAPFLSQVFNAQMQEVMPFCDVVFGNESEAEAYAASNGFEGASVQETALRIASQRKASGTRCRTVIITQGSEKTIVARNGKVEEFAVEPLDKELIVDTNGAGDAFVGGFLSQWVLGEDIARCVAAGHYAARVVIQQSGCVLPGKPEFA